MAETWPCGPQDALGGDADVVIGCERLTDEIAEDVVLEDVEPFRIAERNLPSAAARRRGMPAAREPRAACNSDPPCSRPRVTARHTIGSARRISDVLLAAQAERSALPWIAFRLPPTK